MKISRKKFFILMSVWTSILLILFFSFWAVLPIILGFAVGYIFCKLIYNSIYYKNYDYLSWSPGDGYRFITINGHILMHVNKSTAKDTLKCDVLKTPNDIYKVIIELPGGIKIFDEYTEKNAALRIKKIYEADDTLILNNSILSHLGCSDEVICRHEKNSLLKLKRAVYMHAWFKAAINS